MTNEVLENYLSVGANVMTFDTPSREDVVTKIPANSYENNNESYDKNDESEESHAETPPTFSIAFEFTIKLQTFFKGRGEKDDGFQATSLIRSTQESDNKKEINQFLLLCPI